MINLMSALARAAISISCLTVIGCASPKPVQELSVAAVPAAKNSPALASLKPIYAIAAPSAATLNKFAYFYDQDRGDSFFVTAPTAKTLFQIGADEGALFQSITKTTKTSMSDNDFVRVTDGAIFLLNSAHELQVISVDISPRSFGVQKLSGLINPKGMAVSKLSPGYRIAVIDELPTGNVLKLFRADLKSKTIFDVGDLDLLTVKATGELDLGELSTVSISANPIEAGFILTQDKILRFVTADGQFTEQAAIKLNSETIGVDVMACNRGTDSGYWIALQKMSSGYQIELLRRLNFESLGVVTLAEVTSATDIRYLGRTTKYLPNGGVYLIANEKLAAYNWQDIATALGARKMCF